MTFDLCDHHGNQTPTFPPSGVGLGTDQNFSVPVPVLVLSFRCRFPDGSFFGSYFVIAIWDGENVQKKSLYRPPSLIRGRSLFPGSLKVLLSQELRSTI